MKNYYYFLGIDYNASDEDIKKAYRKLSMKYHPDKNEGDDFFVERFREVQEAYEVLIDAERRKMYNASFENALKTQRSTLPPEIQSFSVDKIRVKKGEPITIYWKTTNADVVKIMPFGLEKPSGERTFKITEFNDGKFQLLLHAQNTMLRKTVVKGILITELKSGEVQHSTPEAQGKSTESANESKMSLKVFLLLLATIFILLAMYLMLNS
ncbi:J domain-containing protein [Bergeyella porcorum]|uniref:J domain-containing protein n=1 Tax=Bergeyella porcorum TaxID=1735111 RepID=UPI0035EEE787